MKKEKIITGTQLKITGEQEIPKKLLELGYKHIPEEELIEEYNNLPENHTMCHVDVEFNEETLEIKFIRRVEYGIYLKRKERREKLEKITKINES